MKEKNQEEIIKKYGENARKVLDIIDKIKQEENQVKDSKENEGEERWNGRKHYNTSTFRGV